MRHFMPNVVKMIGKVDDLAWRHGYLIRRCLSLTGTALRPTLRVFLFRVFLFWVFSFVFKGGGIYRRSFLLSLFIFLRFGNIQIFGFVFAVELWFLRISTRRRFGSCILLQVVFWQPCRILGAMFLMWNVFEIFFSGISG